MHLSLINLHCMAILNDRYHSASVMDKPTREVAPIFVEKLPSKLHANEGDSIEFTVVIQG